MKRGYYFLRTDYPQVRWDGPFEAESVGDAYRQLQHSCCKLLPEETHVLVKVKGNELYDDRIWEWKP